MNKVFKVVYSKSKGCYVVVPETAKNNNGKKKVLASVLAGLALVGAGAHMGTPVEAYTSPDRSVNTDHSRINIAANAKPANSVGVNSIVVGYQNTTDDNDGTTALGANNQAYGNSGLAIGNQNESSGGASTAIGAGNRANGAATVAIGNVSNANANGAIAIGSYNNVNYTPNTWQTTPKQAGDHSIVVGSYSHAAGNQNVAIGNNVKTEHDDSVAIGADVSALAGHNIAIGSGGTKAQSAPGKTGSAAIAIGLNAQATYGNDAGAYDMIAVGNQATASANAATAIGTLSKATGNNSTAIGNKATASASGALAFGQATQATAHGALATGNGAQSKGVGSTAVGRTAKANNDGSVAVGFNAEATGDHAIAIGGDGKGAAFNDSPNTYDGLGNKTTATATNAISVGYNAKADKVDGVALGSNSVTTTDKGVVGYNPSNPHERKYAPLTGNVQTATTAAVSIGNGSTLTRQLTGLAAGTADTDAVNVAQLKNVGVAVTGNTGKSDFLTDGGKLNVIGTGRVSTVAAHDGAKDSRITVGFDDTGMVKAGKNVKVDEVTVNGKTTYTINAADTAAKYDFLTNATANGGKVDGTAKPATVQSGTTVNYAAGKNLTVKQDIKQSIGEQTYTYSLNSDLGGITSITNNGGTTMHFGPDNISITGGNLDLGGNNITNLKSGGDVINNAANIGDVTRISKANEKHIKPGEYAVDNNGKVTMTYVDGNNKDVPNETAVITGIAKQDLSNINNGGKTVIKNLAKEAIDMENGKNTTASHRDVNGVKTFKVDVEGDLTDITSITNKDGDGKVVFGGNQTVNVAGDHNINLNAKVGDITGLTNVTLDAPDFAKKGRAATEEQLNIVNNKFNNTVGLTGNTGATELQKLNKQGGLSFGVVGANNGEYIKTTASGSNVVADLSDSAKNKLNSTVEVQGKNAAKVTSNVVQNADGSSKTIYTVDVNNVTPTAASTEKVQAKADVAGSSDKNIAKVSPKTGDQFGEAGATYEVNVSRNDVKDAAREAVTVNTTNTTNNPITVTPVQDEANHNTTYQVTFDGDKAAKQIPLTYKANGTNEQKVTLDKGLNFTNGRNTTASVDAEGVVKYDVNKDLVDIHSISNTTNGPKMEFGPNSINITGGPINMGDQNITNLKSGGDVINNAANIGDVKRISKANDLHIAPTSSDRQGETTTSYAYDAASKSVTLKYNDGNGANQSGTVAKIDLSGLADQIKDGYSFSTDAKGNVVGNHAVTPVANGKTVSYAAGKNLTVAQNIDNATGEHTYTYALSNDVDLTPNGSLKIGDTILNNGGLTITGGPSVTKTGINAGNLNITNVKAGVNDTDAVNVKQLKDARTVVTSNDNSVTVNKTENGNQVTYDLHVAPGAAQSVWNVKST
ncbi:MAG: ESPR-type extended signal peptide-containing protein [Veillonella sp.]|nr:ESPR-type extended signal peptide-containing protein [Veillonella sp.]MDU6548489.1 ESPR-type extended signal peptide-containing protein [Veillonella sp.]